LLEYSFRNKNLLFENIPITGKVDKIELSLSQFSLQTSPNPLLLGEVRTRDEATES
jgi:hypothetical protein